MGKERTKETKEKWHCGPAGSLSSAMAGGFVAGVVAAAVLVIVRVAIGLGAIALLLRILPWHAPTRRIVHGSLWASLKLAAFPLVGDRVYRPGFDAPVVSLAIVVLMVMSIGVGVVFGLVARGRSRLATCAIAIWFGLGAWTAQLILLNPSPVTVIEAIPSGLALALTFLWYERRLSAHPRTRRLAY